jgi:hypothetical protein
MRAGQDSPPPGDGGDVLGGLCPVAGPSPTPERADHGGRVAGVLVPPLQVPDTGTYVRLFPELPPFVADMDALIRLGMSGGPMDPDPAGTPTPKSEQSGTVPAGFTYFGQFLDHNITFQADATFDLGNQPGATTNFRSGRISLEHVYGLGPETQAFEYYDQNAVGNFWIDPARPYDVARNAQGTPVIPDPRNDNTVITIQIHLAFQKFHNAVVALLAAQGVAEDQLFATAHQLVVWHFQWLVANEWLPLVVEPSVYADVRANGPRYYKRDGTSLPVEFTCAAYRLHSLVLEDYQLNDTTSGDLFGLRRPFAPLTEAQVIDWSYFFDFGDGKLAYAKRFEAKVSHTFLNMPGPIDSPLEWPSNIPPTQALRSIAVRNLLRGNAFGLPSGQAVAELLGQQPLTKDELGLTGSGLAEAPLWYYVLAEADLTAGGVTLGATGSRIVAEVLFGLLSDDPSSYVNVDPGWTPTLGARPGAFTMVDLLRVAGVHP